jgi:isocitrate dehydrogenase
MPNLYGDILSDVAAQIAGSVGLAGSANIGVKYAMFEAIHGSAPRRAGQNLANPSGLLLGAVMMLVHIGQEDIAERVHNAWLRAIEDGVHTYDIYTEGVSKKKVGTKEFAQAVVSRVGQKPQKLREVVYKKGPSQMGQNVAAGSGSAKETVGVDVFIDWTAGTAAELGPVIENITGPDLKLVMIDSRGTKVYPDGFPDTTTSDMWRCRFMAKADNAAVSHDQIIGLLQRFNGAKIDFIKTENLCTFDGKAGYSLGQGQ